MIGDKNQAIIAQNKTRSYPQIADNHGHSVSFVRRDGA
jgi:hypothetical protein